MHKSLLIWNFIYKNLQKANPAILLYVMDSKGSSPGRQGFFMAVNQNGDMEGSIGGGIMEHKFVELARERISVSSQESGPDSYRVKRQIHDKSAAANQSGMICSGEQMILLYLVQQKDLPAIQSLIYSLEKKENGTLSLSPSGIQFEETIAEKDFDFAFHSDEEWLYKEKTGYKNKLFIIGGGHCSLSLSNLMCKMDFYIHVYDDRKELKTMQENESAHEKHFVNDYSSLEDLIPDGENHYVVIMTFGYRTDDIALKALINKQFKYLGVLGSKKKMEKLFTDYRKEKTSESLLQAIRTPIGLDIKSQTPEEIAVSIAAEIVKIKNSVTMD